MNRLKLILSLSLLAASKFLSAEEKTEKKETALQLAFAEKFYSYVPFPVLFENHFYRDVQRIRHYLSKSYYIGVVGSDEKKMKEAYPQPNTFEASLVQFRDEQHPVYQKEFASLRKKIVESLKDSKARMEASAEEDKIETPSPNGGEVGASSAPAPKVSFKEFLGCVQNTKSLLNGFLIAEERKEVQTMGTLQAVLTTLEGFKGEIKGGGLVCGVHLKAPNLENLPYIDQAMLFDLISKATNEADAAATLNLYALGLKGEASPLDLIFWNLNWNRLVRENLEFPKVDKILSGFETSFEKDLLNVREQLKKGAHPIDLQVDAAEYKAKLLEQWKAAEAEIL
jgi:hypothetical protein